jgi:dTDP-4-amino-4,6-dideoxygalactose transaminase
MDEVRAAYGLLNLKYVDKAIVNRKIIAQTYREGLKQIKGISCLHDIEGIRHNYSYFPIFVDEKEYGLTRDELYQKLKDNNILGRRYFYPLISDFSTYRELDSANPTNLPIANKVAEQVICLPIYDNLELVDVERIINVIFK